MNIANELELKTRVFWKLSQIWNGRIVHNLPTGEAIDICNEIMMFLGPQRPLHHCTDGILQEIIVGEGNKREPAKILEFTKPIKKQKRSRT